MHSDDERFVAERPVVGRRVLDAIDLRDEIDPPHAVAEPGEQGPQGPPGPLQWIDYASHWDTAPTEVSAGVLSYTWLGVTRYRNVPDPYVASSDAFYSDAGLTNLIIARGL